MINRWDQGDCESCGATRLRQCHPIDRERVQQVSLRVDCSQSMRELFNRAALRRLTLSPGLDRLVHRCGD